MRRLFRRTRREYGTPVERRTDLTGQTVTVEPVTGDRAALLSVEDGTPVLVVRRNGLLVGLFPPCTCGQPVEDHAPSIVRAYGVEYVAGEAP